MQTTMLIALTLVPINGYSQDIGQLQADVSAINTELARQTHFRGYFTTNDEILELINPAIGDYAYSAEDLLVWDYDGSQWVETDKIVSDQMTPASDANPLSDGALNAGTSAEYSRRDHIHPLNISTSVPISDTADGAVVISVNYARSNHSHPINISDTTPLQDIAGDRFVVKTGKTLQEVQGVLRHSGDDEESEDDEDYVTRKVIANQYASKATADTIVGRKIFKNDQFQIQPA
ncbi:MAG: hypothetical protein EZS28_042725, partial [Streblomastix strix]